MSNRNLTPKMILKEFLSHVRAELIMPEMMYRDYDSEIANRREGDTVYIRRPLNFTVNDGANLVTQDTQQGEIPITVDKRHHVGLTYSDDDLQLSMPEFVRKRSLTEAARAMAQKINSNMFDLYKDLYNWAGTPGQTINSMADWNKAPLLLDKFDVPAANRYGVVTPTDGWALADSQYGLYGSDKLIEEAWKKGMLSRDAGGVRLFRNSQVRNHTVGTYGGTPEVDGANQNVTYAAAADTWTQTLATDGWSSGATSLKKGDVFTIDGVYAVNPSSKDTLTDLQQFVVKSDISDTSGDISMTISPPIITSGPYQTVSAAPANDAGINMLGTSATTYAQNMAFHKNTFCFVPVPIKVPESAVVKASVTDRTENGKLEGGYQGTGLTFTMVKDFNISDYSENCRIDVLYGLKTIRPELACRVSGTS